MNTPQIRYYAELANTTEKGKKTPKFTITYCAGYYPPMEQLRGRDGKISVYITENTTSGANVSPFRLQAKNSLNLTGLKDFMSNGELSNFSCGYPFEKPTYSKGNKPNPFYEYRNDGFLFVIHKDENEPLNQIPTKIEMLVVSGGKPLISSYCKMLAMGGFDECLNALRQQAQK